MGLGYGLSHFFLIKQFVFVFIVSCLLPRCCALSVLMLVLMLVDQGTTMPCPLGSLVALSSAVGSGSASELLQKHSPARGMEWMQTDGVRGSTFMRIFAKSAAELDATSNEGQLFQITGCFLHKFIQEFNSLPRRAELFS